MKTRAKVMMIWSGSLLLQVCLLGPALLSRSEDAILLAILLNQFTGSIHRSTSTESRNCPAPPERPTPPQVESGHPAGAGQAVTRLTS